ncbi:MAG: helix-turn-helix domain-containing protein [Romboutsia timonensis]|uniref:helix-turn-helix domain-containing protein n=1 Tax=Romboutsia timonensis TaxID=1776391 RepID=UPI0039909C4B
MKGSFEGLYTFLEVAEIYGIDDSCLRKQVARDKFVIGEDVKKMGRTWIITEQAMIKSFGALKFEEYKKKQQKKEQVKEIKLERVRQNSGSKAQKISKVSGQKRKRSSKKVHSMNEKEEKVRDSWINGEIKGVELKSFDFNINDSNEV